jgi:hypothetical protein
MTDRGETLKHWIRSSVFGLIFLAFMVWIIWPERPPPSLSTVTADNFSFEEYGRGLDLAALKKIFPVGTPKAFVDKILVEKAHATASFFDPKENLAVYSHKANASQKYLDCPAHMTWSVRVRYDAQLQVQDISIRGPC